VQVAHDRTRWNNADADRIEIVDPDPEWPRQFDAEVRALRAALPSLADFRIEHFGSTAVPGLRAKPIIDLLIIHPEQGEWPSLVDPLAALGYVYWAGNPRKDRMFFVKGMPPFGARRTHHLHVRVPDDASAELRFRDALRADAGLARDYGVLKDELAARHAGDRDAYTNAKTQFVASVLERR
jgi:GrpB-like predicted nucleotidyltransferase (UPF0157 family)